jgi:hypothetical protein
VPPSFGARAQPTPRLTVLGLDPDHAQIASSTSAKTSTSREKQRRISRIAGELDLLELVPFSNADAAFAPAVAIERRARALGDEHLVKRTADPGGRSRSQGQAHREWAAHSGGAGMGSGAR